MTMIRIVACIALVACSRPRNEASPMPSASASAATTIAIPSASASAVPPPDISNAIARLGDPRQEVRDAAAAEIRQAIAENPAASGDRGETYWKEKLAAIPLGATRAEVERLTGAKPGGRLGGGGGFSVNYRLDDYWMFTGVFTQPDRFREASSLRRVPREVHVDIPDGFTGRVVTYFVNGSKASDIEYVRGDEKKVTRHPP